VAQRPVGKPLTISLFITCYNDTLFPETGKAVVHVLERLGHRVEFRSAQTCCGQMHYNTGYGADAAALSAFRRRVHGLDHLRALNVLRRNDSRALSEDGGW
jgi:Fe-S oxidoreductase